MRLSIRQATGQDIDAVIDILREATAWLEQRGMPLWRQDELQPNDISAEVRSGLFFLAEYGGEPAGTVKVQLEDKLFWPDVPQDGSAFVHRLAIKRRFAGGEVSSALLLWAIARTHALGRRYLRLDCEASRTRLRSVYERVGFGFHSNRQVGPYFVARYEYDVRQISPATQKPKMNGLPPQLFQRFIRQGIVHDHFRGHVLRNLIGGLLNSQQNLDAFQRNSAIAAESFNDNVVRLPRQFFIHAETFANCVGGACRVGTNEAQGLDFTTQQLARLSAVFADLVERRAEARKGEVQKLAGMANKGKP